MGAQIVCGAGPRGLEQVWLARLTADQQALRREPLRLRQPALVLVPSRSLRRHCMAAAVQASVDPAGVLLGVRFATLPQLCEMLVEPERLRGQKAFAALVRRALPPTWSEAERRLVAASVRDLLHALFDESNAEQCFEVLQESRLPARLAERAAFVLRTALEVRAACRRDGLCAPGEELRLAAAAVRGGRLDAHRWVHVLGFADATGSARELLCELAQRASVTLFQDRLAEELPGCDFGRSLREALPAASEHAAADPRGRIELVRGRVEAAELREVARRVESCLASGVPPERIAIVARQLEPLLSPLRRILHSLGIPCSALGARGSIRPSLRAARALQEFVQRGCELRLERWRLAEARALVEAGDAALKACHALGATTLRELAELDLELCLGDLERVVLPVQALGDAEQELSSVPRGRIVALQLGARELQADWQTLLAARDSAADLTPLLGRFLRRHFCLDETRLAAVEQEFLADAAPGFEWRGAEACEALLVDWVESAREAGAAADGGQGGGVALLDVMEARARSFDALFVIGLQAGRFPMRAGEDALLPDSLRRKLAVVLPDLSIKASIAEEDRYHFESLLRSAAEVTLSWSLGDADGTEKPASALLEALRRQSGLALPEPSELPQAWTERSDALAEERSLARAVLAPELPHREVWSEALGEARAGALEAVLCELEPSWQRRSVPGLYLGEVGPVLAPDRSLSVSALESSARCPWKAFLTRVLRLAPASDPLAFVPELPAHVLGTVVHAVLESIGAGGGRVAWPAPARLRELTQAAALRAVRREQLVPLGLRHWLVERALPYLEIAGQLHGAGAAEILGSERQGRHALPASVRTLSFRADRVERDAGGEVWTDFKTGQPLTLKVQKRLDALLEGVRSGLHLQAAVYAVASGTRGRYVYLKPGLPEHARVLECAADADTQAALEDALLRLDALWREGGFVPRLAQAGREAEPQDCRQCEVRIACQRGDSGAKLRLQRWMEAPPQPDAPAWERAAHAVLVRVCESEGEE